MSTREPSALIRSHRAVASAGCIYPSRSGQAGSMSLTFWVVRVVLMRITASSHRYAAFAERCIREGRVLARRILLKAKRSMTEGNGRRA